MKNTFLLVLVIFSFMCNAQEDKKVDNYTIKRLIVINENNEIAMVKYGDTWNIPPLRFNTSETYNEALKSLADKMGITTSKPKLGGMFSFKYGFISTAALRMFYVAKYKTGKLTKQEGWDDIKWMKKDEVLKLNNQDIYSFMACQVIKKPETIWGGAFYLYKENEKVKYDVIEDFYPL